MRFRDRAEAGRLLAERVEESLSLTSPVVLALPRGGVPVAAPVAARIGAPLDVFVARKLIAPKRREVGIGAIAEGSDDVVWTHRADVLSAAEKATLVAEQRAELARRVTRYRADRPLPPITGRDVVLVDDGLATGVTAEAAVRALGGLGAARLVLAVPVCSPRAATRLAGLVDRLVCLACPQGFRAVARWYDEFPQVEDAEVLDVLGRPAA